MKVFEHWLSQYDEPSWEELAEGIEICFPEWESGIEKFTRAKMGKFYITKKIMKFSQANSKSAFVETKDVSDGMHLDGSLVFLKTNFLKWRRNMKEQMIEDRLFLTYG